ncbi:MAG: radical SAM protein [Candidatus Diapherotrites archaeon]|uniref:Radical SAM protein n=1 Tax=Candidatus Iainarchaeum sp. TaxID=3101447 RepID=A0A938YQH6_9ARCH|nr:radical SAM protein [Candidatus Diapherotrites archaeon]
MPLEILRKTSSLCPECLKVLPANVFEEQGKVWIEKECKQHGYFKEIYWSDAEMYKRARRFDRVGRGLQNPNVKGKVKCPESCGLCPLHKTNSTLTNIVLTNRCDLNCWYCFFFAQKAGYVYEPTIEQIKGMLEKVREERPVPGNAVQLTGGEPTLREDLVEIIHACKELGFDHVQLNTDGIRICNDPALAQRVRAAGVNTLYLSFDGVTAKANPKNHWEIPGVLENCRKADLGIVLVPTVINTVNDHEIGDMMRFGFNNLDVVRGINFQPVSLVGRMPQREREKVRITIPDVIHGIEEQTNGEVTVDDFYPVPTVVPIAEFIEHLRKKPQYEMSAHFACGMATYIFKDGNKMVPITRFLDVDGFVEFLNERTEELKKGKSRYIVGAKSLFKLNSFIDRERMPSGINLGKILFDVFLKHDYRSLGVFHHKSLFVGMMHFMDLYNYDVQRVQRCAIHYATPDHERPIVPFCAFNVIPEWYRDKIQKKFAVPIKEWEQRNGRKLTDDLYRRGLNNMKRESLEREMLEAQAR